MLPKIALACALAAVMCPFCSCTTAQRQYWDSLKGEGFPGWSDSVASGVRGNAAAAKPSGFFTDRRSEQIEQNLGGGF